MRCTKGGSSDKRVACDKKSLARATWAPTEMLGRQISNFLLSDVLSVSVFVSLSLSVSLSPTWRSEGMVQPRTAQERQGECALRSSQGLAPWPRGCRGAALRSLRHSCKGRPPSLPAALLIARLYPASLRRSASSPGPNRPLSRREAPVTPTPPLPRPYSLLSSVLLVLRPEPSLDLVAWQSSSGGLPCHAAVGWTQASSQQGSWQRRRPTTARTAQTPEHCADEVHRRNNPLGHGAEGLERNVVRACPALGVL